MLSPCNIMLVVFAVFAVGVGVARSQSMPEPQNKSKTISPQKSDKGEAIPPVSTRGPAYPSSQRGSAYPPGSQRRRAFPESPVLRKSAPMAPTSVQGPLPPVDNTIPLPEGATLPDCPKWDWSKGSPPPMRPPFDRSKLYCPPPPFNPPNPPTGCICRQ
jgi:hypothetical protein